MNIAAEDDANYLFYNDQIDHFKEGCDDLITKHYLVSTQSGWQRKNVFFFFCKAGNCLSLGWGHAAVSPPLPSFLLRCTYPMFNSFLFYIKPFRRELHHWCRPLSGKNSSGGTRDVWVAAVNGQVLSSSNFTLLSTSVAHVDTTPPPSCCIPTIGNRKGWRKYLDKKPWSKLAKELALWWIRKMTKNLAENTKTWIRVKEKHRESHYMKCLWHNSFVKRILPMANEMEWKSCYTVCHSHIALISLCSVTQGDVNNLTVSYNYLRP